MSRVFRVLLERVFGEGTAVSDGMRIVVLPRVHLRRASSSAPSGISKRPGWWIFPLNLAHTLQVIVGGTKIVDDYYPAPRPETAEDILKRGFELCPELAPPEIRA